MIMVKKSLVGIKKYAEEADKVELENQEVIKIGKNLKSNIILSVFKYSISTKYKNTI